MRVVSKMENPEAVDPTEYRRQKEEYEKQRETFMRKQLRRAWPTRVVRILGVFQLSISLAILGLDLPIVLMFAPRWQVFAGCWTFVLGFIACVSTFHSTRKMTWLKLKWAVALNVLAGLAAGVMTAFDILYLVNPYVCVNVGGCNYLWYTYSVVKPYYTGQVILGIALLLTAFIFLFLFIKYGIGGTTLFENIEKGWAPAIYKPMVPPHGAMQVPRNPATGPGVAAANARRPPPPQQYPGMVRYPPAGYPGPMVPLRQRPPPPVPAGYVGPMTPSGQRPPMSAGYVVPMTPSGQRPPTPAGYVGPMTPSGQRPPTPGQYGQPGTYTPTPSHQEH